MTDKKQEKEILRYVNENQVTIVNSITCGKMPIYLAKDYKVIVATPEEGIFEKYCRTKRKIDSTIYMKHSTLNNFLNYQIAFISYGCNLIQEVLKNKDDMNTVLIIDDSCNCTNADLLIAFVNQLIKEGANLRLVIINKILKYNNKLSEFFDYAPIVDLSPKSYHVSYRLKPAKELEKLIFYFVEHSSHKNILVILPGIEDIRNLKEKLNRHFENMIQKPIIISLYSSSVNYDSIKVPHQKVILATNLAQTMLLNFDIDVVIDMGLEKIWKMVNEVPVLTMQNVSKATIQERKALAGFNSPGLYYLCSDFDYDRKEVNTVLVNCLDQMILTLIYYNIDIKSLHLIYPKSKYMLYCYLKSLRLLGAIDENIKITHLGKEINKLPFDTRFARMFIEAKKYNLEFDVLICYILTCFNIQIHHETTDTLNCAIKSDLLYQIDIIKNLYFKNQVISLNESDLKTFEHFKKMISSFSSMLKIEPTTYNNDLANMKKCIACGFPDCLFILTSKTGYKNVFSSQYSYTTSRHSRVVRGEDKYVVGIFSMMNRACKNSFGVLENRGIIIFPTVYTFDEVIECFSQHLQLSYSVLDGRNIFRNQTYKGIIISSEFHGTVEDLRLSSQEDFHEKIELDDESGKTVIALYFHDIKVNTRPYKII